MRVPNQRHSRVGLAPALGGKTYAGTTLRYFAACVVATIAALTPGVAAAADTGSLEYAVKAAYLYKFGFFVEWPSTAFSSPSSPVNLCVAGEDPFGPTLDDAVSGQHIGERAIVVRRLKTVGRDSGCHILYLGGSDAQRNAQIIETVRGSSVLTVSDTRGPGAAVGIINLVIKDNRVRFEIDDAAAAQNGLAISSKLLSLALNVRQRSFQEIR